MDSMELYKDVMSLLDKAGVPRDTRWRSLLLYLREVKDYTHLSDVQKVGIQSIMADLYSSRDYSEESLHRLLDNYRDCIVAPFQKKIETLLMEAGSLIQEFQNILQQRSGNINDLEESTIVIATQNTGTAKQIEELHNAFSQIKDFFVKDLRSLETLATRDALTGLYNRRAFDDFMENAITEWLDNDRPLALAIFDIDRFKSFNDTHGHRIGDQVLALVAKYMLKAADNVSAGNRAIVARYGGEEFVLVISGRGIKQLPEITQKIRREIRQFNFLIRDVEGNVLESDVHVTVSAGIAEMSRDWSGVYLDNLIDSADKALYYAKHHGRDKAVMFRAGQEQPFVVVPSTFTKQQLSWPTSPARFDPCG